jgi:hypothetical protein
MIRSLIFNNHNLQAPSNNYDSRGARSVLTNVVIKFFLLKVTFNLKIIIIWFDKKFGVILKTLFWISKNFSSKDFSTN